MSNDKCIGLLGRLFGHKYRKRGLDYVLTWAHCFRCGKPAGGCS